MSAPMSAPASATSRRALVISDYVPLAVRTVTTGTLPSLDPRQDTTGLATLPTRGRTW